MSGSSSFSGTITGGVQDISALLPLLGTEQCENHVGSALDNGFLYSSVTPLSIFGSLGIVRAAFNILIASLSIRRFRFLGATKLSDGGFTPNGVVAPMIALDPKHPKRFLAETRLEEMLAEEHIENVEDLMVSWNEGIWWWNSRLILFSTVISLAALVPYVAIILDGPRVPLKTFFPLGFGFPILRVVGSALCVNVAQFLLQLRILVILKTRILFIAIDRLVKEKGIPDLESMIKNCQQGGPWTSDVASERCIWALRTWLASSDTESTGHRSEVKEIYESQRDFQKMKPLNELITPWVNVLLVFFLILGGLSTVIGYVGCFYLIQQATSSKGPLLWLGLEALLSIIRIFVWALNPLWDDSKGIVFNLRLTSHAPLITCNKSQDDFVDRIAPLMRSNSFLEGVVAYTGPVPAFVVPDVTLYYILTAKRRSNDDAPPPGILYLVLSDQKEQTSRVLYKERTKGDFRIFLSTLHPVPGSTTINVKVDLSEKGGTTDKTHFLTSDPVFMAELGTHYNEISQKIKMRDSSISTAPFVKTWAMHQPPSKDNNGDKGTQPANKDEEKSNLLELTAEDMAYLRQGQLERRRHDMYSQLETWIRLLLALYTKELLEDVPNVDSNQDTSVKAVQEYEANEVEFLIIECSRILELCLISTARQWDKSVKTAHTSMVKAILQGTFNRENATRAAQEQHIELIRRKKLRIRLADEKESLLKKEHRMRRDNRQTRLAEQMESTKQRIQGRQYTDNTIMKTWKALLDGIASDVVGSPDSSLENIGSVIESASHSIGALGTTQSRSASIKEGATVLSSPDYQQNPHGIDDETLKSKSAGIIKIIASRQTMFEAGVRDRYKKTKNVAQSEAGWNEQLFEVAHADAEARCHQRADLVFSRLKVQADEFGDLHANDVLTANAHPLVDYWSTESLQERVRLQDRRQKFLELTEASFKAVGGRQNMSQALKRSQDFAFIQFNLASLRIDSEFVKLLVSIAEGVKSEFDLASLDVDSEFDLASLRIDSEFVKYLVSIVAGVKSEFDLASLDDNLKDPVSTVGGVKSEFVKYLVKSGSNLASLDVDLEFVKYLVSTFGGVKSEFVKYLVKSGSNLASLDVDSEFVKYLVSIVEGVKSVTGVSGEPRELFRDPRVVSALKSNVETAAEAKRDICSYTDVDVMVTDYYRKGWPYLLCWTRSALVCEVIFYTTAPKCDHIIRLRHTLVDDNTRVNVDLNGSKLKPQFRQRQNFNIEDIDLPKDHLRDDGQRNNLRITLDESSASAYWISDVFFPVEPKKSAQSDKS